MARYWVYINNDVVGPYTVEELIRVRGFSRQTRVRVDDPSAPQSEWMSPAAIPELAPIFRAVEEHQSSLAAEPAPKLAPKPIVPRTAAKPVAAANRPPRVRSWTWMLWLILGLSAAAVAGGGYRVLAHKRADQEREMARSLVRQARFPPESRYRRFEEYIQDKQASVRWDIEKTADAVYRVSASWYGEGADHTYAFETNTQAQTVRGLNTAAIKLLTEGVGARASKAAGPPPVTSAPAPSHWFAPALKARAEALENGDFAAVWSSFSRRKRSEMAQAGMSQDGFIRLQSLTYRVDSPVQQTVLKTKKESETQVLALLKQAQAGRPDVFIKQLWIWEADAWKLDDEEKRAASAAPSASESGAAADPATRTAVPASAALPGMSN